MFRSRGRTVIAFWIQSTMPQLKTVKAETSTSPARCQKMDDIAIVLQRRGIDKRKRPDPGKPRQAKKESRFLS